MPLSKRNKERFLEEISRARGYSQNTVSAYSKDLTRFQDFLAERQYMVSDLESRSSKVIRDFVRRLHADGLSNRSICRVLSAMKSFFKYLHREGITATNLGESIMGIRFDKKLPRFLVQADLERLVEFPDPETFAGSRDLAIIELLYSTGCRLSELVGIRYDDIDFEGGSVRILGKRRKERIVPLGKYARIAVENYMQIRQVTFPHSTVAHIFLNRLGTALNQRSVSRVIRKYSSLLGNVDPVSPHAIRHSFATHLLDNGADIMAIKEMLGHSSLSTTQVYSHVSLDRLKRVYDKSHPRSGK